MLKAEALYLADRSPEALAAIKEAEILARRIEVRGWSAELQLLDSEGPDEGSHASRDRGIAWYRSAKDSVPLGYGMIGNTLGLFAVQNERRDLDRPPQHPLEDEDDDEYEDDSLGPCPYPNQPGL